MAFLGLSSSIVNQVGSTVAGWVKNPFNRTFFYWYFFPALAFVMFQQYVIGPVAYDIKPPDLIEYANAAFTTPIPASDLGESPDLGGAELTTTPGPEATATPPPFELPASETPASDYFIYLFISFLGADLFYFIIVPFVMAVALNAIAFQLTRFYEGFVWPLSWLLAPLKLRNTRKSKEMYSGLFDKRLEYLRLYRLEKKLAKAEAEGVPPVEGQPALKDMRAQIGNLKREIQKLHEAIEKKSGGKPALPSDLGRVTPTALGNALAVAEEYSFDRYGIDSVLFWPRLRAELDEVSLLPLDSAKGVVDGMLNFSLLAYIVALESVGIAVLMLLRYTPVEPAPMPLLILFGSGLLGIAAGYGAYRGSVGAAQSMGALMNTYFDYHRDKVLEKFSLKRPDMLEDEKITWYKLGAFLRRGESFYFPEEAEAD